MLYATRPIKRGEEICDCYIELRQNTAARQRDLKEYYRFTCSCTACSDLSLSTDDAATATTTGAVVGTDTGTDTDTKDESDSHINSGGAGGDKQVSSVFTSVEAIAPVVNKSSKLTTSQHMGRATTMDDENRVMALRLDKQMMQLAEEEQVQKALNCAFEIIKVRSYYLGHRCDQGMLCICTASVSCAVLPVSSCVPDLYVCLTVLLVHVRYCMLAPVCVCV